MPTPIADRPHPWTHIPNSETRAIARENARIRLPLKDIATLIGVGIETLHKHYDKDMDAGRATGGSSVANVIYTQANSPNHPATSWKWAEKHLDGWSDKAPAGAGRTVNVIINTGIQREVDVIEASEAQGAPQAALEPVDAQPTMIDVTPAPKRRAPVKRKKPAAAKSGKQSGKQSGKRKAPAPK